MGASVGAVCANNGNDESTYDVICIDSAEAHSQSERRKWSSMQVSSLGELDNERINPWTRDNRHLEEEGLVLTDGMVHCSCFSEEPPKTIAPKAYLADSPADGAIVVSNEGPRGSHSFKD
eukprot:TRINITY_DN26511_c0_g1_i2.p1 TRINITY_DN26511_c0_g1~~TRINITY_DN26511_c0_g1_i2.p1  ORF type:complete len:120 (-),score=11.48 TRINITY_DN26511_c0_g1_i2:143-502(-)